MLLSRMCDSGGSFFSFVSSSLSRSSLFFCSIFLFFTSFSLGEKIDIFETFKRVRLFVRLSLLFGICFRLSSSFFFTRVFLFYSIDINQYVEMFWTLIPLVCGFIFNSNLHQSIECQCKMAQMRQHVKQTNLRILWAWSGKCTN